MVSEWPVGTIGDVAEKVAMGPFGSSIKVETFVPEGVPVISGQHLRSFRLDETARFNFVSPEHAERLKNANVRKGDVIFTHAGNIGQVAYIPANSTYERYVISQRQFYMRCNPKRVIPEFVVYYFKTPDGRHQLLANTSQVGVPSIAQPVSYLRTIEIPVPPLPDQRAIAHILGTLDDKIELNRRMNETLEAMARALFKSWFVDFDPVRAKLDGRHPVGLDAATAALFPTHFQDSPLGHIPQGWEVKPLSEITTVITKGTTPTQEEMDSAPSTDARINYVRVNSIEEDGSIIFDKLTKIPLSVHTGVLKRSILQANDVLYTIAGTIGRIATAEDWVLPANTNQAVAIIRPKPTIPSSFLVLTMRHDVFREELHNNIVHAVQANLSLGMLSKARAVVPPGDVLLKMFKPIADIMSQISANHSQSRTLAVLRDSLLPKLISGELRISRGKRMSGETTV